MTTHTFDAVVVGLGPGGEDLAGKLAEAGMSVVGIEGNLVGGECPYWGCVPSKMMVRAANLLAEARRIPGMAGASEVTPDWAPVAHRIRAEATDNWNDRVAVERLEGKGGTFVRGWAKVTGPRSVAVGGDQYTASRALVLATGTEPAVPPIGGLAGTPYWTNRHAIEVETLPRSLAILGGGSVGVELGQVFARFGVEVTVIEALDRLVALEEPEASELVATALAEDGIQLRVGTGATKIGYSPADGFAVHLNGTEPVTAERLLVATGRHTALDRLGVEALGVPGVTSGAKWLPIDEHCRVAPGVWAIGDVTGKAAFTHMAMYQAGIATRSILGEVGPPADYRAVPRVTFTDPEVGAVGMTEAQARDEGLPIRIGFSRVPESARGWIHKAGNAGFIKLIEDSDRGVLVGATSVGPVGGEVLGALAVAIRATVRTEALRHMIYAYPTFHRGIEDALRNLG
ncbi:MAG TPA: NAD(P)/FAD-dependent oxidoreductase [Actinomycetes bacterium]|nr:NAD(P)/FAD-dependent oxidoreductase [Actinomycetes bacterium]